MAPSCLKMSLEKRDVTLIRLLAAAKSIIRKSAKYRNEFRTTVPHIKSQTYELVSEATILCLRNHTARLPRLFHNLRISLY